MTVGVALLLLTSPLAGPAEAQVYQRGEEQTPQERQFERGRSTPAQEPSTNLPDWAAPSSPKEPGANKNGVEKMAPSPPPPSTPSRIPVDGGLALLAAAGAGYAVRKLKGGEDDTDDAVA